MNKYPGQVGKKTKLLIVQPYLASYRVPIIKELARRWQVTLISSNPHQTSGFGNFQFDDKDNVRHILVSEKKYLGGKVLYQPEVIMQLLFLKPEKIWIAANFHYISTIIAVFLARLVGAELFLHGHGFIHKEKNHYLTILFFKLAIFLSAGYICYTPSVRKSLANVGIPAQKLFIAENTLEIKSTLDPTKRFQNNMGILFLGRLRSDCDLELLVEVVEGLRRKTLEDINIQVIGGGDLENLYRSKYGNLSWVKFHGIIFDQEQIASIAQLCLLGCYPGDAGLSVVHYMALSLPPVIHSTMQKHYGPEPSYVQDGHNGFFFEKNNRISLENVLSEVLFNQDLQKRVQIEAYNTYLQLSEPPFFMKLHTIFSAPKSHKVH